MQGHDPQSAALKKISLHKAQHSQRAAPVGGETSASSDFSPPDLARHTLHVGHDGPAGAAHRFGGARAALLAIETNPSRRHASTRPERNYPAGAGHAG